MRKLQLLKRTSIIGNNNTHVTNQKEAKIGALTSKLVPPNCQLCQPLQNPKNVGWNNVKQKQRNSVDYIASLILLLQLADTNWGKLQKIQNFAKRTISCDWPWNKQSFERPRFLQNNKNEATHIPTKQCVQTFSIGNLVSQWAIGVSMVNSHYSGYSKRC